MDLIKKNKKILIVLAVLAIGFFGYKYMKGADSGPAFVASEPTPEAVFLGQQILTVLNELRSLQIDDSVFKNPVYKSLVDHSIATTSEPLGRPDPFEEIPAEERSSLRLQ